MTRISSAHLACAALLVFISIAHAGIIDFSGLANYTVVSNQYPGVVFSLQGQPESSGPPMTYDWGIGEGLDNSDTYWYPTANILDLAFTSPVSGLSFTFTNYGTDAPTTYTAYDASSNVIDTGSLQNVGQGFFELVTVNGSGIADLKINNNLGNEDWEYAIQTVTFTSSVPEPASLAMAGSALVGLLALWRRKRHAA